MVGGLLQNGVIGGRVPLPPEAASTLLPVVKMMDSVTANQLFVSIMAIGCGVWLWSLMRALRLGRSPRHPDRYAAEQPLEFDAETGELTVQGDCASLSEALVGSIRQRRNGLWESPLKVTEHSSERVTITRTGSLICNQPAGLYFSEVDFRFVPLGAGTVRVSYCIGYARLVRLLKKIALWIILGLGLPVIVIVGLVVWVFVVHCESPIIRWQVLQTLQIIHVLWPPFLVLWFYTLGRRQTKVFVENLIKSLEIWY